MRRSVLLPALLAACVAGAFAGVTLGADAASGPTLQAAPFEVGAPVLGQRLTAEPGSWDGSGTVSFHYQWYRCDSGVARCRSIHGATGRSYRIVAADVAHTIALTVTATDGKGSTSAYASALGPVAARATGLVSTVQPESSGPVKQGLTVHVDDGTWSRKPSSVAYQWLRCNANGRICSPVDGATANTYIATSADAGHALVPRVTASDGSASVSVLGRTVPPAPDQPPTTTAKTTTAIGTTTTTNSPGSAPRNTSAPTIGGTAGVGLKLTATPGAWVGSGTLSYHFQWYRCDTSGAHCISVHGATAPTYTPGGRDVGHTIGLTVTATDAGGTGNGYAHLVGPIAIAEATLVETAQPAVSGSPKVGQQLTVSTGSWTTQPSSYDYAWMRCNENGRLCSAISGATSASYTVADADRGHQLLALVHAVAGDATAEALSTGVTVP